ncbi:MAG: LamG-like jellyroll fold domain-containing protein [Planctomycetota bacterium]
MGKEKAWLLVTLLLASATGCQDVRLKDGIICYRGQPAFIAGVWAGYSVTYKLPRFKEGIDPDLPMYTMPFNEDVARHVGFLSAHPAVPIRDMLDRLAPQCIRRPKEKDEEDLYRTFVAGMDDLPLAIDFAAVHVFGDVDPKKAGLAPEMYQQNPNWCNFVPLCPENPEAWKFYEDYFRTGAAKSLAAGANPFIYEIFNEPAYNCQCRWNRKMFRERMEQQYGDIAAANKIWGTNFKDFAEIEKVLTARDHPGLWADWMKFIGDRYCDVLLKAKQVIANIDKREPVYFMEQPAVSMAYLRTSGIDSYKVAKVMDAVGMEGGVSFGAFKPLTAKDPMEGVIANRRLLTHQIYLDMARSFGKPVINTEFYCARFHDGVRFPSRRSDLTTGLWVELMHGVSSDYFYNWGRRWWEWKDMAGAKRAAREENYKAFSLLNPYAYPPDTLYGVRDFEGEMRLLGDIVLPMPRIKGQLAMLVSNPTIRMMMQKYSYTASGADNPYETHMLDWYNELIFGHYQLDMLYEEDLDTERARGYRAVVVPQTPCLYATSFPALRRYAAGGGTIIAEKGTFARNEYGHPVSHDLTVRWIEDGLKGGKLRTALAAALHGAGVRPPLEIIPEDGSKEPLMAEAYVVDRTDVKMIFLLNWDVRSRLATLRLPDVEHVGKMLDLARHPERMAPRYRVIDPVAAREYAGPASALWSPEDLRKGMPLSLPSQTRKILIVTKKPWPHKLTPTAIADVRREYEAALAIDEKELAMVAAEFEAERKAQESLIVDFGGPKNPNGSYQPDAATVLLCHFDGQLDSAAGEKPETKGAPQFASGKFGTQGVVIREGEQVVYTLPPSFNKDKGTIEAWVKPGWIPNDGERHTVFTLKGPGEWNQNAMGFYKNLNYEFSFYVYDRDKKSHVIKAPINIVKKDTWTHLAMSWDNTSGLKLYVDGKLAKETKAAWQIDPIHKICIGSSGGQRAWHGVIDEVRVSNIVRAATGGK